MPCYSCHDWDIRAKIAKRAFRTSVGKMTVMLTASTTEIEAARRKTDEQFPSFGAVKPYKVKKIPNYDRNRKQSNEPKKCKNPKCKCVLRIGNKKDFCAPCQSRNLKENGLL